MRKNYLDVAKKLLVEKFPKAKCAFVAGSITRGCGTATSDIDLVVVHSVKDLPRAYRESVIYGGYPFELFVQNENSLRYFLDQEPERGVPVLINMISHGHPIPEKNAFALSLQRDAQKRKDTGPTPLSKEDLEKYRYQITDNLDDIVDYRNMAELYGTLSWLYGGLADFYLRANGKWSGVTKHIPQELKDSFPKILPEYESAFRAAFVGDVKPVLNLAEKLLKPFGGRFWAGSKSYAPDAANKGKRN